MDRENSLFTTISPLCFAIMSDKVKERNAAFAKLHVMLPDTIKQTDFTSQVAAKVLKSFIDWTSAELRSLKKSPPAISNNVQSIKELKWIIGLLDEEFGRIKLSESQLLDILDRLGDAISLGFATNECLYVLNQYLLCKTEYSNFIRNSDSSSRINRFLLQLTENVRKSENPESFIKSISFLAISIPFSLKAEPDTYMMLHECFIWYLSRSNSKNDNILNIVLSAVNYILLDYFEHSRCFASKYFEHVIPYLSNCKTFSVCNKIIQLLLQSKSLLSKDYELIIREILSKELELPQQFAIGLVEPVSFCKHLGEGRYFTYNELALLNFFELCSFFQIDCKSSLPYTIFKLIKGEIRTICLNNITFLDAKKSRFSQDWNALAKLYLSSTDLFQSASGSSKEVRWYGLWHVCRHNSSYSYLNVSDIDSFAMSCIKNCLDYSELALTSISEYFSFRFGNLLWTESAKVCFETIFDSLMNLSTMPPLSIPFLNLILLNNNSKILIPSSDPKIKDLELFGRRLKYLESLDSKCISSLDHNSSNVNPSNDSELPEFIQKNISSCIEKLDRDYPDSELIKVLKFIYYMISDSESVDITELLSSFNYITLFIIENFISLIPKRIKITDLLSVLIPAAQANQDSFKCPIQSSTVQITTSEIYRAAMSEEEPVIRISKLLYNSYLDHFKICPKDSEEYQILNDWNTFMKDLTGVKLNQKFHTTPDELNAGFSKFIPENVLTNPKSICKTLSCPEQWYPNIFTAIKSKTSSKNVINDWLFYYFSRAKRNDQETFLDRFISENCTLTDWQFLFLRWIETSSNIKSFPFPKKVKLQDFIIKNAHFSRLLAHFPNFDGMLKVFGMRGNEVFEDQELLAHLMASCLLEEASMKMRSACDRKDIDYSFLKIPSVASVKFVDLSSALLVHGQLYEWPVFVGALQSLAKMFKLSAASDFSDIFNPIHSIFIFHKSCNLVSEADFIDQLFRKIPILTLPNHQKHLRKIIDRRIDNDVESIIAEPEHLSEIVGLIEFAVLFCHYRIFNLNRFSPNLVELAYKLLNLSSMNGSRQFPIDGLDLSAQIKEDMKILILPLGAKVLCFKDKGSSIKCEFSASTLSLRNIALSILGSIKATNSWVSLLIDFIHNEFDSDLVEQFLHQILPKSLDFLNRIDSNLASSVISSAFSELLDSVDGFEIHDSMLQLLDLLVEKSPSGPNFVGILLRRFSNNPKALKLLQSYTAKTPTKALYYFHIMRESPKFGNCELDLNELSTLFKLCDDCDDYISAVHKRLSRFEDKLDLTWPTDKISSDSQKEESKYQWFNRKWIESCDFRPDDFTNISNFKSQALQINRLRKLISGESEKSDESTLLDSSFAILEECSNPKMSSNPRLIKTILDFTSFGALDELKFQTVSLLGLVSTKLEPLSKHLLADMSAQIHFNRGNVERALELGKLSLQLQPAYLPDQWKASLLARLGEWAALTKSERPSHIMSQYFEKALALCENGTFGVTSNAKDENAHPNNSKLLIEGKQTFENSDFRVLSRIHLQVARFLDDQYEQMRNSQDFQSRAQQLEDSKAALSAAKSSSAHMATLNASTRRQIEISLSTLKSQYELDMQEYLDRLRSVNSFLIKALTSYLAALSFSGASEAEMIAAVSRLCALWFANSSFDAASELLNTSITGSKRSGSLPLRLFLPLIYQLAARASFDKTSGKPENAFQRTLLRLLLQLTLNHPFACIYQLQSLRSGAEPAEVEATNKKRRLNVEAEQVADNIFDSHHRKRAEAAEVILAQAKKVASIASAIDSIETLVETYVQLANSSPPSQTTSRCEWKCNRNLRYPLPSDSPLRHLPIPTQSDELIKFAGFIDGYRLLGGINLPKLIEVVDESGRRHAQLVKGRDDVRQDAVMEQIFIRVNRLLENDPGTRKRRLGIRTYRVIPLRPLVGLLEWVPHSVPFATYLTEAHPRLRPGDLHPSECRDKLEAEFEKPGSSVQSKLKVLLRDIGQNFSPVLRHFFFEHFAPGSDWWTAKQVYTSSLATASIVGWIVGLGDRHGMNILLDKNSGAVVHIDLNMIFEAGRTLRIPERVPFRLTPDCIDPLGPEALALDGPFRNHAISALKVLRKERSLLLMILDVFKFDPLQKWAGIAKVIHNNFNNVNSKNYNNNCIIMANTTENTTKSPQNSDLISKEADRALMRIKEKLEGREEGVILSESGHVDFLIKQATDPELICQMYFGWQAYF